MATRKDVAQRAGVSVATVSYVLNGTKKVTAEVEARVRKAVHELDYRPNLLARGLSMKKTHHVALVVDNMHNPHISDVLFGAQEIASQNGYIVSVLSVDISRPQDLLDLTRRGVDGVILALATDNQRLQDLLDPDMPVASVGEYLKLEQDQAIDDMVAHLTGLGHRRIAFLSGLPHQEPYHPRFLSLAKALNARGLSMEPELVVSGRSVTSVNEAEGARAMSELLDRKVPFTAVYAINDLVAMGAIRALRMRGLKVPEDVSVVGNDRLEVYRWVTPTLATMEGCAVEIGRRLMQQMIDRITSKPLQECTLVVKYVPGESVGPAAAGPHRWT
ncbi:MAG: LacI family DNA-binding transcriptional regulator [Eubacteriales bacterium]|nr:LacI family DNA-binding transcriptional regulator [Eubacteriales bacterium]